MEGFSGDAFGCQVDPVLRNTTAGGLRSPVNQTAEHQAQGVIYPACAHDHKYTAGSSGVLACTTCGKLKT